MSPRARRNTIVGLVAASILIAVVALPPVRNLARAVIAYCYWDIFQNSTITLGERKIVLPRGQFGWIRHEPGSVTISPRDTQRNFVLLVESSRAGETITDSVFLKLCESRKCRDEQDSEIDFLGRKARLVKYSYRDERLGDRTDAVLYEISKPGYVRIFAASERFEDAWAVASSVYSQVASSTK